MAPEAAPDPPPDPSGTTAQGPREPAPSLLLQASGAGFKASAELHGHSLRHVRLEPDPKDERPWDLTRKLTTEQLSLLLTAFLKDAARKVTAKRAKDSSACWLSMFGQAYIEVEPQLSMHHRDGALQQWQLQMAEMRLYLWDVDLLFGSHACKHLCPCCVKAWRDEHTVGKFVEETKPNLLLKIRRIWKPPAAKPGSLPSKESGVGGQLIADGFSIQPGRFGQGPDGESYFMITKRWKCRAVDHPARGQGNKASFLEWDAERLALQPEFVQMAFPFRLSAKRAVSDDAVDRVTSVTQAGGNPNSAAAAMTSSGREAHYSKQLMFESMQQWQKQEVRQGHEDIRTSARGALRDYPQFAGKDFSAGFCSDLLKEGTEDFVSETMAQLASSQCSCVMKLDGGLKNAKKVRTSTHEKIFKATTTLMNGEEGKICAIWHHDGGLAELEPELLKLYLTGRFNPIICYTDVPRSHKYILTRCFPSLGKGLPDGDIGVRGDVMHLLANHSDHFTSGHALARDAADDLAATLKVLDADDMERWRQHCAANPKVASGPPPGHRVRTYYPEPQELLRRYQRWVDKWENAKDMTTGASLFNQGLRDLIERTKEDFKCWFYSDPVTMKHGNFERIPLHKNLAASGLPDYYCMRGTNRLESFHTQSHDLLDGGNNSADYFQQRLTVLIGRWNINSGIRICGEPDYKTYDIPLLRRINAACAAQGKPEPYKLPPIIPPSERINHGFHFAWQEDAILADLEGLSPDKRQECLRTKLAELYPAKAPPDWRAKPQPDLDVPSPTAAIDARMEEAKAAMKAALDADDYPLQQRCMAALQSLQAERAALVAPQPGPASAAALPLPAPLPNPQQVLHATAAAVAAAAAQQHLSPQQMQSALVQAVSTVGSRLMAMSATQATPRQLFGTATTPPPPPANLILPPPTQQQGLPAPKQPSAAPTPQAQPLGRATNTVRQPVSQGPRRRTAYVRRTISGRRDLTIGDMTRSIVSTEEVDLWFQLYDEFQAAGRKKWQKMAAAWNAHVWDLARARTSSTITLKQAKHLKEFEKTVVQTMRAEHSRVLASGPSPPPSAASPIQQATLAHLFKKINTSTVGAKRPIDEQAAPDQAASSKKGRKENKVNSQGEGAKKCGACGTSLKGDMTAHRATCEAFASKNPEAAQRAAAALEKKQAKAAQKPASGPPSTPALDEELHDMLDEQAA